jgi:hypothetical protein
MYTCTVAGLLHLNHRGGVHGALARRVLQAANRMVAVDTLSRWQMHTLDQQRTKYDCGLGNNLWVYTRSPGVHHQQVYYTTTRALCTAVCRHTLFRSADLPADLSGLPPQHEHLRQRRQRQIQLYSTQLLRRSCALRIVFCGSCNGESCRPED